MIDSFSPRLDERRKAIIFFNGHFTKGGGKILYIDQDMPIINLLCAASKRLNMNAQRCFSVDGHEIDDSILIDNDDCLFFFVNYHGCEVIAFRGNFHGLVLRFFNQLFYQLGLYYELS